MTDAPASSRERWAWCGYDFANSAFTTIIVTVAYSVYFTRVVAPEDGEAWWGRGYAASMLLAGLLSPILGAVADATASKRRWLIVMTVVCVAPTALLGWVGPGDLAWGLGLFIVANVGYNAALHLYDAFLKELTPADTLGRLSGWGWGFGYLGGLVSLALAYPFLAGGMEGEAAAHYRLAFPVTAAFFALAALPTFVWLTERAAPVPNAGSPWLAGIRRVVETLRHLGRHRQLVRYFVAYFVFNDAVNTVFVFAAIFATQVLAFTAQDLVIFFLIMQLSSAAGAGAFGWVTDRLGGVRAISSTLVAMIGITVWAARVQTTSEFYVIGLFTGALLGANQAASRTLLAHFAPPGRGAEFFGLFSLTSKFAATLGPLLYGEIARATGSHRTAVLSIGALFLAGLLLLQRVNEAAGRHEATAGYDAGPHPD
ncbi:MAG TPA: MFS transporter [Nitrospiria bacterium]|nr:MFS transporter [Nitrospiria bacterium]